MRLKKILLTLFLCFIYIEAFAQYNIVPQRIIIAPNQRSAEVTIFNMSDKPAIVAVSIRHTEPVNDGSYNFHEAAVNPVFDPEKHIRFTPRQFELPGNGRQKVRISVRKPRNLPEGSYSFHIRSARYEIDTTKAVGVGMTVHIAYQIPVILHHGRISFDAKLENPEIQYSEQSGKKDDYIFFDVKNNNSTIPVTIAKAVWEPADTSKEPYQLGIVANMYIFNNYERRRFPMHLVNPIPREEKGRLRLTLFDDFNKGEILDELLFDF